jgi:hypothetical protein
MGENTLKPLNLPPECQIDVRAGMETHTFCQNLIHDKLKLQKYHKMSMGMKWASWGVLAISVAL